MQSSATDPVIRGSCNCGAVTFEIDGPVDTLFACHCSICRRYTGAAHIAVAVIANERFRWTGGAEHASHWKHPDADWESWFCSTCGSALPGVNDPDRMYIPAGLLPANLGAARVAHHIFVGSKASWDAIGDDGAQHDGHIGDT